MSGNGQFEKQSQLDTNNSSPIFAIHPFFHGNIICKMKLLIVLLLFFIKFCASNDFECAIKDGIGSVAFFCENFNETLPENCATSYLYSTGNLEASKVTLLKIGGCDEEKIRQIVDNFRNILSLDISCSGLQSLKPFNVKLHHLRKFNVSHNQLAETPRMVWKKMPQLMEVDISHNRLTFVWDLPRSLTWIDLSYNNILFIGSNDLTYLPNMEYINLSHNQLEKIEHYDIFGSAGNLIELHLEYNRFKNFNENVLRLMTRNVAVHFSWENVKDFKIEKNIGRPIRFVLNSTQEGVWISFDGNHIEFHCRKGSFSNIHRFKFIDNHIENPTEMLRCLTPSLEKLTLIGHFNEQLKSTSLESFINLSELIINGAPSMEFDLGSIENVEHRQIHTLDISGNNLKDIRNSSLLTRIPIITILNLAENRLNISSLLQSMNSINHSTQVGQLNLSGNFIGKLNLSTFRNFDVIELYLRNTKLSFDDVQPFELFGNLKELDISHNNLENTNFSMPSIAFKKLYYFSAAHCNVTNVPGLIKLLGSQLQILDLSGNHIGQLNATAFDELINLKSLNLSQTHLIGIDFGIFRHMNYFYELDLSSNNLSSLNVTSTATYLGVIYLNGNELTHIKPITWSNFPELWTLSISNNRIPCAELVKIEHDLPDVTFLNSPFEQKHGDCSSVVRLINKLGFIGTFISKWI